MFGCAFIAVITEPESVNYGANPISFYKRCRTQGIRLMQKGEL